jgi:hypothetical protein
LAASGRAQALLLRWRSSGKHTLQHFLDEDNTSKGPALRKKNKNKKIEVLI